MFHTVRLLTILLLCSAFLQAQIVPDKNPSEDAEKLQKEAVAFLRESLADVNSMRSLENRISFTAEMAGLMWFYDEREARAMYNGAIGDYRDLIAKYDAQMNALGLAPEDSENQNSLPSFLVEPTDRSRIQRKFVTAMAVGQQIAMSLAEHDADLGYAFYYDSLSGVTNPEFRKQIENGSSFFESQLLTQISENNPAKAAQLASRSLAKGITYQHIELLKKVYAKDPDKGAEFGAAILSRVKNDKLTSKDFFVVGSLLEFGDQNLEASRKPGAKRPVYKSNELRDLAELLAQMILARTEGEASMGMGYLSAIQKYAPGRAAQIQAKFKRNLSTSNSNAVPRSYLNTASNVAYGDDDDDGPPPPSNANAAVARSLREREEREKAERTLFEDIQGLGGKQLPKEERAKFINQARKIISQTPGREKKVAGLSLLAAQVSRLGDKELAAEIMKEAAELVSPTPKNYKEFLLSWMLASGYASVDPDKAFILLEETIGRANNTLEAFVKVGEFMDVAEEMIQDGEVQVGAFGGQMVRGLTRELGMADSTIQQLAKADFGKMKNLTNRFERPEIRILAKMMVLRAVLNPKGPEKPEDILPMIEPDGS